MNPQTRKILDRLFTQLQYAPSFQVGRLRREIRRILMRDTEVNGVVITKIERVKKE